MARRDFGETTLVMPYASIEASPGGAATSARSGVLLEATLLWGRDTLAVRHIPARGEVRVRDLGLDALGALAAQGSHGGDLLVGDVDRNAAAFVLRLPNGTAVPEGCRMTLRMGRALVRLALVPDDVAKLPRSRRDPLVAFGILAAAVLHVIVLGTIAHSRSDEGETEAAARATMLKMVASAEERASSELVAAQQKSREMAADDHAPSSALASTPAREEAKAGNVAKTDRTVARARITRGEDSPCRREGSADDHSSSRSEASATTQLRSASSASSVVMPRRAAGFRRSRRRRDAPQWATSSGRRSTTRRA